MQTWLTSDIHFFHENIIMYCGRPYGGVTDMNEKIIEEWNRVVEDDDRVIFVGDLSAGLRGRAEELGQIIGRLKGHKHLIRGNHDHQTDDWYLAAGFESVAEWLLEDGKLFVHKPATELNAEVVKLCAEVEHELVIHGHIHHRGPKIPGHFNVAWDRHYRMVNLTEVRDESQTD